MTAKFLGTTTTDLGHILGTDIGNCALTLGSYIINKTHAHYYDLEIIAPQPSLDIKNRFYMAYPGIEYNVRMAVIGGSYPFEYSLTTSPSGMTINHRTGEIIWSNPTVSGSPHSVAAKVVDQEGNSDTVSWTITVQTGNFIFVDEVNGHNTPTGDGTIANPFKDFVDIAEGTTYANRDSTTYSGYFVYFRSGTYLLDGYTEGSPGEYNNYIQWPSGKPRVFIGYPGDTVTLSAANHHWMVWTASTGFYIDNLNFNIASDHWGIFAENNMDNVQFRRVNFYGLTGGGTGSNSHCMMSYYNSTSKGSYWVWQDNTFTDSGSTTEGPSYWILTYVITKFLIEDNNITNFNDGHVIGLKEGPTYGFIRNNRITSCTGNLVHGMLSTDHGEAGSLEISHNLLMSSSWGNGVGLWVEPDYGDSGTNNYIFRNTIVNAAAQAGYSTSSVQYWYNNVIINTDTTYTDHVDDSELDGGSVVLSGNVSGVSADNKTDANGKLTGTSKTNYLGIAGYELYG